MPERVLRSDAIGTADIVAAESAIIVLLDVMAAVVRLRRPDDAGVLPESACRVRADTV